jgi:hypothetical protein
MRYIALTEVHKFEMTRTPMRMTFNIFLINYKSNLVDIAIGICRHVRMYHLISCLDDGVPINISSTSRTKRNDMA